MKLNVACGNRTKQGFINIDSRERENELDMVLDLTKEFPFERDSVDYIYAEQFIEHLTWLEGHEFLVNCFRCLKEGGILRLVLPHYEKIFKKYLEGDDDFFKVFYDGLNKGDYPYYISVYENPEKVRKERKGNLPPEWHLSPRFKDRKRLEERIRHFNYNIEVVDWFVHQYKEHKCLYDYVSLEGILKKVGFSSVIETEIKDIDSHAPTRLTSSIFIEGVK